MGHMSFVNPSSPTVPVQPQQLTPSVETHPYTQVALDQLSQLIKTTTPEATRELMGIMRANPASPFLWIYNHLVISAKTWNQPNELSLLRHLMIAAFELKTSDNDLRHYVTSRNAIFPEVVIDALKREPFCEHDGFIIQWLAAHSILSLDPSRLTLQDYIRMGQLGINLNSSYLFAYSPLIHALRTDDESLLSLLLKAGCL
jgi:hypothetical protein